MLRKLLGLIAAVGMIGTVSTTASAGVFLPLDSTISVQLAALPQLSVSGSYSADPATLGAALTGTPGNHVVSLNGLVWQTAGLSVGSGLLTGVPALDNLTLTVTNATGTFADGFSAANPIGTGGLCTAGGIPGGPCIGGSVPLDGTFILQLAGGLQAAFPLHPGVATGVGIGGSTNVSIGGGLTIQATFAPWITGKARLTNITTNIVQLTRQTAMGAPVILTGAPVNLEPTASEDLKTFTTGNGFLSTNPANPTQVVNTVTVGGSALSVNSASGGSLVVLISPFRVNAGALGQPIIPGFFRNRYVFFGVPEPGTVLLLVSGAAGLVVLGRRRMKKG